MWRLNRSRQRATGDNERGATAVITAILMVVLLGFAAISIDVGMLYAEKAQLQNGADSAALAVAYDCAKSTTSSGCTTPAPIAATMTTANANDHLANMNGVTIDFTKRTVKVDVSSKSTTNPNAIQLVFANIFGISSANVPATATAIWPAPSNLATIPWTVGQCFFDQSLTAAQKTQLANTGSFTPNPNPTLYIRSDTKAPYPPGCSLANGSFSWLDVVVGSQCQATAIPAGSNILDSSPGNDAGQIFTNPACPGLPDSLLGKEMYIPLFSSSNGGGNPATYTISGFAKFFVTGWHFGSKYNYDGINPPTCPGGSNDCRGFFGYFTGYLTIDQYMAIQPPSPNQTVRLIK